MDVVIAGGHGNIARRLARLMASRGDRVRGLIRNPEHAADLEADGSEPVLCDLESASDAEVAAAVSGADAVVFAAGAGPGSGSERKLTMDREGAIKLLDAARSANVARYVIVSSVGAENPPAGDDTFSVYLRAKAEADRALAESDRDWTIVRPGMLQDTPGEGRVRIQTEPIRAEVSRDDVAAVLAAVLGEPRSVGRILYVVGGDEPIDEALAATLG
jgi:uncharacterized protein YbjT (DUF2867 family)